MDWIEAVVKTTTMGSEVVSEIMHSLGAQGTVIEDKADFEALRADSDRWDFIDDELMASVSPDVLVKCYYADSTSILDTLNELAASLRYVKTLELGFDLGSLELTTHKVNDADWENNWKKYYHPFAVGEKLWIQPQWIETPVPQDRIVMWIDPGPAFGTGTHETTFMCMQWLEKVVSPGIRVADVGCGTGILAIVSKLLGAGEVLAVDRDDICVSATKNNIALNPGCEDITVRKGSLLQGIEEEFDLIVSNIIAEIIIDFCPDAYRKICDGGYFITSGIIKEKCQAVVDALKATGFDVQGIENKGEWVAILARK